MFQSPGGQGQRDWLQFSVRLGGQQFCSNYNTHIQYVFVERSLESKRNSSVLNPLHPDEYDAELDSKIYDRWYTYDQDLYCSPGVMISRRDCTYILWRGRVFWF